MAGNREIPQLTELAFKAFLRARKDFNFETTPTHDAIIEEQILKRGRPFLQSIADANPPDVKKCLEDCPELAVLAIGIVTTVSGYTYQNVSAVELVYLMDDVEMANMMLPYIKELSEEVRKKADNQLAKKMAEVEKQRALFKPYDFTEIVKAICADQTLKDTGKPSPATEKALTKFKEDFKPGDIKEGKSWIKEHLQEGFRVYDQNWDPWTGNQLRWYLINIIGHMETRAEKCFEQECSQGLKEIVDEKKPARRTSTIKNYINDLPLTYRGSLDSSLLLGRDFFVEIYFGGGLGAAGGRGGMGRGGGGVSLAILQIYVEQKDQAWKNLSSSLTNYNQLTLRL
jgi:hypothetical protein